jgi:antitoxin FitA
MAQLLVRNLENDVKAKLQRRAKRNGRSMEEEVREILRDATKGEGKHKGCGLGTEISALFRKHGLRQGEEIPELRDIRLEIPDFNE